MAQELIYDNKNDEKDQKAFEKKHGPENFSKKVKKKSCKKTE
jgi:hypothetical protein